MASERVSRAIIDLVADPSGLKAGLAEGKRDVVGLGASVSALAKSISADFASSSDAARKFGADVKAAVVGAETSSKGLGTALSKVVGTDTIERANAYARAVTAIGGVSKLTTANQELLSKALDSAARQYAAIGVTAPKSLSDLASSAKAALAATDALEKEGAAVQQQFARFSGRNVIQDANAMAAAVKQLGGAAKLTAADQATVNRAVQDALGYYKSLGQQGPAALVALEKETRKVEDATSLWKTGLATAIGTFSGFLSAQAVMSGLRSTFGFVKDAVFGMNSTLETATLQFTTLMGGADQAKAHVLDLFEFAKKTPFETGPVIEASRLLRVFGKDALDTSQNLTLIGNASATAGAPINELAFWVGRLFAQLKGGQPFGEAAMRLQELAVMSPEVRTQMEGLQKAGKSADEVFAVFQGHLESFSGAMERQAGTWSGVTSTFSDTVNLMLADALRPLFDATRDGLRAINDVMASPVFEQSSKNIARSIREAFGGDSQGAIKGTAGAVVTIGQVAVTTAEVVGRAFSALRLVFAGTASVIDSALLAIATSALRINQAMASLPGGSQYQPIVDSLQLTVAALRASQQGFHDQAEAALQGVKGNDAWAKTLGEAHNSLDAMRSQLAPAATETAAHAAATDKAGAAQATYAQQLAAAKAQLEGLRKTAPETYRDLTEAVKSGNVSLGDMSKQYKVAELAVKLLQDQFQETKKGATAAATEATNLGKSLDRVKDAAIPLTAAQKAVVDENNRLGISHSDTARIIGRSTDAVDLYSDSVKNAAAVDEMWTKTHAEWAKSARAATAGWYDDFIKGQRAEADASASSLTRLLGERQQYQNRVSAIGLSGTRLALLRIDQEEAAERASWGERTKQNASAYDALSALSEQYYADQRRQLTSVWASVAPEIGRTLDGLRQGISSSFAQMLTGAQSFRDGFVGIWQSIKASLTNIFGEIADAFIQGALRKILAATAGSSLTGGASSWAGLARSAIGLGGSVGAGAASSALPGTAFTMTAAGAVPAGAGAGAGAGGAGLGLTTGATGAALGIGAAAGGGIASGMLGKWLAGGAGWKAGGIGAAGGAATGALIGTAIFPGVGTGVGAGVGALAGLITGLVGRSKGGKEDDQANKDLTSARAGLVGQYGSVENIAALDRAVGTNLAAGWGEAGKKGALAFAAEAQRFETSVKAAQDAGVTLSDLMAIGQPEQSVEQRLTKIKGLIEDLGKTGGVASKDLLRLRDSLEGTDEVKAFKTQQSAGAASGIGDFLSSAKVTNQGTASAVGDTLQGSFATMVGQGMSAKDAFAALKPQVDAFNKQLADTGLTGGASFGTLASMAGIVGNEVSGKALTAISGLSGALAGAQNAGFLTQSMFTSLTAEMLTQREAILATGATREDVDALTQKDLQAIWVLQHDNNYEVDAGTQALLTQAEASGTVGDKYRSAMDRAAIAMEKVAASLDIVLGKTDGVGKAIDRIPSKKTITVDIDTRGVAGAFDGLERSGTDATDAVYDGVNAVSFGHSPGGIKEIPIQLGKASTAFDVFATDTARPLRDVKDSIDGAASRTSDLGSALGSMRVPPSFTAEVSTAVTGIGSLVGTTKTVVDDATSGVGVLRGSVQGLSTDTRTAGSTMEGAFAGAVIKGEAARSKVSEITTAVGTVAGALEAVPWQPWSELAIIQAGNAEGAVGKVTAGSVALEIALKRAPWPEWAGNAVSAVQAVTREFDILLGRIAAAATGILTLPTPSAGGSVPPGGSSPTPKPGPVIISKPGDTLPGPARPGPVPGPGTYPGTPGPVRTLLSATPFTLNRSTSAAPASLSSASSANSGKPMTLHAPVSIQVNGDVTDQNARILSDEVVRGLAQKLPRIINQGGTTLTAWRDLPLETP